MSPKSLTGKKSAERGPAIIIASPLCILTIASFFFFGVSLECHITTRSEKCSSSRLDICGVSDISGIKNILRLPFCNICSKYFIYISVFPLPVSPKSKETVCFCKKSTASFCFWESSIFELYSSSSLRLLSWMESSKGTKSARASPSEQI